MSTQVIPSDSLDVSHLHCPMPLLRCLATLHRLPAGAILQVTVSNLDALRDITLLLKRGPHQLQGWHQDQDGRCHFLIRKQASKRGRTLRRSKLDELWTQLWGQRPSLEALALNNATTD